MFHKVSKVPPKATALKSSDFWRESGDFLHWLLFIVFVMFNMFTVSKMFHKLSLNQRRCVRTAAKWISLFKSFEMNIYFKARVKKYIIEKDNRTGLQHNSFHEEEFVLAAQFNVHSHIMTHLLTLKSIKTWKIKVKQATNSIPLLPFRIKLTFYSVTH